MKAKKSLGQNFLKSEPALRKIVEAGEIKPEDIILEIGPGKGALTKKLLEKCRHVIAVEKDYELVSLLKEKFAEQIKSSSLVLVHEDILQFNIDEAVLTFSNGLAGRGTRETEDLRKSSKLRSYKIIANIPYNITGAILKKFLTAKNQPTTMVLMVQHEVAKRIMAYDGKERKNISRKMFEENKINEENFWKIVHAGFAHKRKKLSGNLKKLQISQEPFLRNLGNKRAEDLSPKDWVALVKSAIIRP
ncbi:MAG: Ribosomal RNA small subunit methyltransferase A [Candidatus Nomurabacteria bacterium GW2011_GWA2_40_97]|nr:MAG: Ribosomal RNA small subunit methyltransferase A [Candidatus Nomurabacteria bacterium GW2011_GWA2_40_97]